MPDAAPKSPTPPGVDPLYVYRYAPDGDVLVFDARTPGEGSMQFFSVQQDGLRKFIATRVRPKLTLISAGDERAAAVAAYERHLAASAPPPAPVVAPAPAPVVRAATSKAAAPAADPYAMARIRRHLAAESHAPLFVTGRAGTGKSTILKALAEELKKRCVVLAPTGIAALNVNGQTIHSFFKLPTHPLVPGDVRRGEWCAAAKVIDTLIIDEVSMVRADLLDAVDYGLRRARGDRRPFGGVRVVMFGDPYQLPPVVTREDEAFYPEHGYAGTHFFDAKVLATTALAVLELQVIHRQADPEYREMLNGVRGGRLEPDHWTTLQARVEPADYVELDETIILTTRRDRADEINTKRLASLGDRERVFHAQREGTFDRAIPAPTVLTLKRGARVMFVKNDAAGRWVNGSLGEVTKVEAEGVTVDLDAGTRVPVAREEWQQVEYGVAHHEPVDPDDPDGGDGPEVEKLVVGRYRQLPLQLAWAVTIHKSQGLTFDRAHVDLGRGAFAAGQTYVALSRCRELKGLTLERPLRPADLRTDARVAEFMGRAVPR